MVPIKSMVILLLGIAYLAGVSSALKCYRCQWIEGGEASELIRNSTEACESDPTDQELRDVLSLSYPRKYAQQQAQKAREEAAEQNSKDAARAAREIESLDLKPGSASASDDIYDEDTDEPTDDSPYSYEEQQSSAGPGNFSSSSTPSLPGSNIKPLINDFQSSLPPNDPSSTSIPSQRTGDRRLDTGFDQSQNAILNDFSSIHPICVTTTGIFQNKKFVIRDYHFTETKDSVAGKCGGSYPPEVSTIFEELLNPEQRAEWEKETRAIYGLKLAYCNTDACNNGAYKNEDPCGDGSDPGVRIPLQVPNGRRRFL